MALAGPSKEAKVPSPVDPTRRPRKPARWVAATCRYSSRSRCQRASPTLAARSVEPTISVRTIVASARSARVPGLLAPVRKATVPGEQGADIAGDRPRVVGGALDETGLGDLRRQVRGVAPAAAPAAAGGEAQGRSRDAGQDPAHVAVEEGPVLAPSHSRRCRE